MATQRQSGRTMQSNWNTSLSALLSLFVLLLQWVVSPSCVDGCLAPSGLVFASTRCFPSLSMTQSAHQHSCGRLPLQCKSHQVEPIIIPILCHCPCIFDIFRKSRGTLFPCNLGTRRFGVLLFRSTSRRIGPSHEANSRNTHTTLVRKDQGHPEQHHIWYSR